MTDYRKTLFAPSQLRSNDAQRRLWHGPVEPMDGVHSRGWWSRLKRGGRKK